jgi:ribosomal protein L17
MRLRKGLAGVWDMLSGKAGAIKQQNALEAFEGAKRDQQQRDTLIYAQLRERSALQTEFDQLRARQAQDRRALARDVVASLRQTERIQNAQERGKNRGPEPSHNRRNRGFSLDL